MHSAHMLPYQDPNKLLYDINTRRERLGMCDRPTIRGHYLPSSPARARTYSPIPRREAGLWNRQHPPNDVCHLRGHPNPLEFVKRYPGTRGLHACDRARPQRHHLPLLRAYRPHSETLLPLCRGRTAAKQREQRNGQQQQQ